MFKLVVHLYLGPLSLYNGEDFEVMVMLYDTEQLCVHTSVGISLTRLSQTARSRSTNMSE
jgi:hypothetical protein